MGPPLILAGTNNDFLVAVGTYGLAPVGKKLKIAGWTKNDYSYHGFTPDSSILWMYSPRKKLAILGFYSRNRGSSIIVDACLHQEATRVL